MSKIKYVINDDDLNRWYNIVGVDRDASEKNPNRRYEESDLDYLSPYNDFPKMRGTNEYHIDIGYEYQLFLTKLCEMCNGENPSMDEILNQQSYHKAYLGILRTISHLNLIPENSENWALYFIRHDIILSISMNIMNNMAVEDVKKLYCFIKEKKCRQILKNYSLYGGMLAFLVYLAMHPDCNLPDYCIFENNQSCSLIEKNVLDLISQHFYSKTDYDVDEPPFDVSIIGLKRHPFLPGFIQDKSRMNILSETQIKELLSHYQNPFERVSIQKIKSLTNKDI